jgi:hypothetical protein
MVQHIWENTVKAENLAVKLFPVFYFPVAIVILKKVRYIPIDSPITYSLRFTHYHHPLPITHHPLPITHYQLPITKTLHLSEKGYISNVSAKRFWASVRASWGGRPRRVASMARPRFSDRRE